MSVLPSKIRVVNGNDPNPLGCQRRTKTRIEREQFGNPEIEGLVLYRCYGLDGTLMYIGQTGNLKHRIQYHRRYAPWWPAVEYLTTQSHSNRNILKQDELQAIYAEQPFFNWQGKGRMGAFTLASHRRTVPLWAQTGQYDEIRLADGDILVFPQFNS
jgi:hypothetical protein